MKLPHEFRIIQKSGETRTVQLSTALMEWEGKPSTINFVGDVTERRWAEDALRKSEEKFRRLFESAEEGILLARGETLEFVNPALERILERPADAITSEPFVTFIHPDDRAMILDRHIKRMRGEEQEKSYDFRIVTPDEKVKWLNINAQVVEWEGAKANLSFIADITLRKQAEEAVRDSNEILSSFIRNSPIYAFLKEVTPNESRVLWASENYREMIGIPGSLMVGKNMEELFPLEFARKISKDDWDVVSKGEILRIDEELNNRSYNTIKFPITVGGKNLLAGYTIDITERKRAEEALRESNRRLNAFLELSHAITAVHETASLMQMIVENATKVMNIESGAIYLLTSDDTITLEAITPPLPSDFPEKFRVAKLNDHPRIEKAIRTGEYCIMSDSSTAILTPAEQEVIRLRGLRSNLYLPIRLKDESIGILILSSTERLHTFDEEDVRFLQGFADHAANIISNLRNFEIISKHAAELERHITAQKRAEQEQEKLQSQLAQAQKMESVGRLAGGVAHDFNNMLGVVLGQTELGLLEVRPEDPMRNRLEDIQKAARRSADLTRQLLAFARKQTVAPKVLDLNETVGGMLKILRRLIGEDIDLAWLPGKNLWQVFMDPSQVDQILANLCVNARDAIDGVGKVTIETENIVLDEEDCVRHNHSVPGEFVMLAVSDDGCGMDEETKSHIFEPFFTTKEMGKGTGLGLATVYGIVKQNEGFINVYSEPGEGTTFKIYLPRLADKAVSRSKEEPDQALAIGSDTILLVEDEPAIRKMTTQMLERLGYKVIPAARPGEAISLARKHMGKIDLLMTDVVMPEMNGRDLAANLLSIYPDIKRLFMSGYTANVIAHHGVLDPGVHFIQKPFSLKALAAQVREALGK